MLTVKVCSVMTCSLFFTLSQFIGSFSYYESDRNHCSEQASINKRIIRVTVIFIVLLDIFFTVATSRRSTLTKQRLQTRRHCNYMMYLFLFFPNTLWSLCEQYYLRIWNNCLSQVLWNHYQMQSLCNMNIHWNYLIPLIASQIWIMSSCVQTNGWVM